MSNEMDRPVPDAGDSAGAPAATPAPAGQEALPPAGPRRPRLHPGAGPAARCWRARWRWSLSSAPSPSPSAGEETSRSATEALERAQAALAEVDSFRMH